MCTCLTSEFHVACVRPFLSWPSVLKNPPDGECWLWNLQKELTFQLPWSWIWGCTPLPVHLLALRFWGGCSPQLVSQWRNQLCLPASHHSCLKTWCSHTCPSIRKMFTHVHPWGGLLYALAVGHTYVEFLFPKTWVSHGGCTSKRVNFCSYRGAVFTFQRLFVCLDGGLGVWQHVCIRVCVCVCVIVQIYNMSQPILCLNRSQQRQTLMALLRFTCFR